MTHVRLDNKRRLAVLEHDRESIRLLMLETEKAGAERKSLLNMFHNHTATHELAAGEAASD
jgi:hypothetical protein